MSIPRFYKYALADLSAKTLSLQTHCTKKNAVPPAMQLTLTAGHRVLQRSSILLSCITFYSSSALFYSLPLRFLYLFFCRFSIHLTICNLSYFLFYLLRQYLCTLTQAFSFMFLLHVPRFSIHKYILRNTSSFAHTYYSESGDK